MKIFNIHNIKKFILTFINVIFIFLKTSIIYRTNPLSKFIFFYFPVKAYQKNILELIENLNKKSNVFPYIIYNSFSSEELKKSENALFLDLGYLRFIPFYNFFLSRISFIFSSYVNYVFLSKAKNVYISHDIYDTPMVNKKDEKKLFIELSKLDYIFVSSNIAKIYFKKKFKKYIKKNFDVEIINTGYLKLDHVSRELKNIKEKEDSILLAPTARRHYKKFNLSLNLNKLVTFLLNKNFKVIYRPHPMDLTNKGELYETQETIKKFQDHENFTIDILPSYLKSYSKSFILITDFSGTAYTFSFSQNKPVLFYSNINNIIKKDFKNLYYFNDRKKIGFTVNNLNDLFNKLNKIKNNKNLFKNRIKKLKKKRIENFGMSLKITKKQIEKII